MVLGRVAKKSLQFVGIRHSANVRLRNANAPLFVCQRLWTAQHFSTSQAWYKINGGSSDDSELENSGKESKTLLSDLLTKEMGRGEGTGSQTFQTSIVDLFDKMSEESTNLEKGADEDDTPFLQGVMYRDVLIPSLETHNQLIDDVPYCELPIVSIQSTKQNTMITISDWSGKKQYAQLSGGKVGFKNASKKTSVAAQLVGYTIGQSVRREGLTNVRVLVKGIGQGRFSVRREGLTNVRVLVKGIGQGRFASIQGLKLAGLNIVTITDRTVDFSSQRPRRRPYK